jgi:hypothetical protein
VDYFHKELETFNVKIIPSLHDNKSGLPPHSFESFKKIVEESMPNKQVAGASASSFSNPSQSLSM